MEYFAISFLGMVLILILLAGALYAASLAWKGLRDLWRKFRARRFYDFLGRIGI